MANYSFLLVLLLAFSIDARILKHQLGRSTSQSGIIFNDHHRIVADSELPELLQPVAKCAAMLFTHGGLLYEPADKKYSYTYKVPSKQCIKPSGAPRGTPCLKLCPEPEVNSKIVEATRGDCSGWLISPNQMVTAGHCMEARTDLDIANEATNGDNALLYKQKSRCENLKVLFDFKEQSTAATPPNGTFNKDVDHIFSCVGQIGKYRNDFPVNRTELRTIMRSLTTNPFFDYSVFELDRDVDYEGFAFVPLQSPKDDEGNDFYTSALENTAVVGVSNPRGFTEMYDDSGSITKFYLKNFRATVDTTPGSSGSVVADKATGKAIGLVSLGRGGLNIWEQDNITDSTDRCWRRKEIQCDDEPDQCRRLAIYFATVNQFWDIPFFDQKPTTLPKLSKENSVAGGVRIKALQTLMGYADADVNGIWDTTLSNKIKEKVEGMKTYDDAPLIGTILPASFDGKYITPSVLSMFHCDVMKLLDNGRGGDGGFDLDNNYISTYPRKNPCHAITGDTVLPDPFRAIKVAMHLLNGHEGFTLKPDELSVDNSDDGTDRSMSDKLFNAIKRFSEAKGYTNFDEYIPISMSLWRHLWRTEIDKPSNDP